MPVNSQQSILFPKTNQIQLSVFVRIFSAGRFGFLYSNWQEGVKTLTMTNNYSLDTAVREIFSDLLFIKHYKGTIPRDSFEMSAG